MKFKKLFIILLAIMGIVEIVGGIGYGWTSPTWSKGIWMLLAAMNFRTMAKQDETIGGLFALLNGANNSAIHKMDQEVVDKSIGDQIIDGMSKSGQFVGFREINQAHKMGKVIEEEMAKGGGQA